MNATETMRPHPETRRPITETMPPKGETKGSQTETPRRADDALRERLAREWTGAGR